MKKSIARCLCLLLIPSLIGCSKTDNNLKETTKETTTDTEQIIDIDDPSKDDILATEEEVEALSATEAELEDKAEDGFKVPNEEEIKDILEDLGYECYSEAEYGWAYCLVSSGGQLVCDVSLIKASSSATYDHISEVLKSDYEEYYSYDTTLYTVYDEPQKYYAYTSDNAVHYYSDGEYGITIIIHPEYESVLLPLLSALNLPYYEDISVGSGQSENETLTNLSTDSGQSLSDWMEVFRSNFLSATQEVQFDESYIIDILSVMNSSIFERDESLDNIDGDAYVGMLNDMYSICIWQNASGQITKASLRVDVDFYTGADETTQNVIILLTIATMKTAFPDYSTDRVVEIYVDSFDTGCYDAKNDITVLTYSDSKYVVLSIIYSDKMGLSNGEYVGESADYTDEDIIDLLYEYTYVYYDPNFAYAADRTITVGEAIEAMAYSIDSVTVNKINDDEYEVEIDCLLWISTDSDTQELAYYFTSDELVERGLLESKTIDVLVNTYNCTSEVTKVNGSIQEKYSFDVLVFGMVS